MELPEKVYNAVGNFGYSRVKPLDLSSVWSDKPTESQMRLYAFEYVNGGIALPADTIKVQYVDLGETVEFAGCTPKEPVLLGDTVSIVFDDTGEKSTARVTETRYKPLLDRYESITVGKVNAIADIIAGAFGKAIAKNSLNNGFGW